MMPDTADQSIGLDDLSSMGDDAQRAALSLAALIFNVAAGVLILISWYFRIDQLGNIPGLNGDEALIGVNALHLLRHQPVAWMTPNGNPDDPFSLLAAVLLHAVFPPSIIVLRIPAVIAGIAAVVIAARAGGRVVGASSAAVFALLLSVLPEDIVQSRLGWEPSESLLATLIVLILSVLILEDSSRGVGRMIWAAVALIAAMLCHPSNVFIAVYPIGAVLMRYGREIRTLYNPKVSGLKAVAAYALTALLIGGYTAWRWPQIDHGLTLLLQTNSAQVFPIYYARLLNGITALRYVAGSWYPDTMPPSAIAVVTWTTLAVAVLPILWGIARSCRKEPQLRPSDRLLFFGWAAMMAGFFVIAGSDALTPGNERNALVLIAPTIAALCRAFGLLTCGKHWLRGLCAMAALAASGAFLMMFYEGYLQYFQQTAGTSETAYLTGPIDPKQAAWQVIRSEDDQPQETGLVLTGTWWNSAPLYYFAMADPHNKIAVVNDNQVATPAAVQEVESLQALGRLWVVEFAGSQQLGAVEQNLQAQHARYRKTVIYGYDRVPIDVVIHVGASGSSATNGGAGG